MAFFANKKIILSLILALILIAGGFWFIYRNRQTETQNQPKILASAASKTISENPDSDKDGLKDWEEKLWGTDPFNPDTDGDGTADGQEIKLTPESEQPDSSETTENKSTLSADIARNFFSDYISFKNQGLSDDQIKDELYDSLVLRLEKEQKSEGPAPAGSFSAADAKLSGASKENIRNYANALGAIIKSEFKKNSLNEMLLLKDILTESSQTGDYGGLNIFEDYQKAYLDAAAKMRRLAVPPDYAAYHADLAGSFNNFAAINGVFGNFGADPFKGILAVNNYQQEVKRSSAALSGLVIKFLVDGVEFESGEDGYLFVEIDKQLNAL